jgi:NAD(P)H-hydrate epimerase
VLLVNRKRTADAKPALLAEAGVPLVDVTDAWIAEQVGGALAGSALIVDSLLGIGRVRPIGGAMKSVLEAAALAGCPIVGLDIPSGLDADGGACDPATPRCAVTVTLGAVKRGLVLREGPTRAGRIVLVPIGIPRQCARDLSLEFLTGEVVAPLIPPREVVGHKGTFGRVLVIAGSAQYVGAPLLASLGAARGGAGLVTLAAPGNTGSAAAGRAPEITHLPLPGPSGHLEIDALEPLAGAASGYAAAILGPGLGRERETAVLLRALLQEPRLRNGPRWVIDADALTLLSEREPPPGAGADWHWSELLPPDAVLTPHPREMARLLGEEQVPEDRIEVALRSAAEWRTNLVLKGAYTVVAAPDGRGGVCPAANPALATAGTGDVLTGAIAALIAQGAAPFDAARAGVATHAAAGELARQARGPGGVVAGDVADLLPQATDLLRHGRDPWSLESSRSMT